MWTARRPWLFEAAQAKPPEDRQSSVFDGVFDGKGRWNCSQYSRAIDGDSA
jgi:hypothetical protein